MNWPDPAALLPLLVHLSTYGELYPAELNRAAHHWLPLLTDAGWVASLDCEVYRVTNAYLALPAGLSELERQRRICFAIPAYRRYLIAVLAEGLVQAGQMDYHEQLERWVTHDLAGLSSEINALLDELEAGQGHMVEWPTEDATARFDDWHTQLKSFAAWDRTLLGVSVKHDQLFMAVLCRVEALSMPRSEGVSQDTPAALLPDFDLTRDARGHLALPPPVPWSTARQSICSSLRFFDAQGNPLYDMTQPVSVTWQDVLAQQPYYRAVLRTAIAVRFSSYRPDRLELFSPNELGDTRVLISGQERGSLADRLPHLVEVLGFRALSRPSPSRVGQILEHWIAVGALEVRGGQIFLRESYARTLHERHRALMLLRGPAEEEWVRLERYLRETR